MLQETSAKPFIVESSSLGFREAGAGERKSADTCLLEFLMIYQFSAQGVFGVYGFKTQTSVDNRVGVGECAAHLAVELFRGTDCLPLIRTALCRCQAETFEPRANKRTSAGCRQIQGFYKHSILMVKCL